MVFQPGAPPYVFLLLALLAHAVVSSHAPLQRVPTSVPLTQLRANGSAWHASVSRAFNNNTVFLDMMLGILVVNVSVGTPPQNFTVGLDTGSADFWLIDSECSSVDCMGEPGSGYAKHRFNTTDSTTFVNNGSAVEINYIIGSDRTTVSGTLAYDTLRFGSIVDVHQPMGVMNQAGVGVGYAPFDGIFAAGWPSKASFSEPPIHRIASQLNKPLFTIWLDRHPFVSATYDGMITYGELDSVNCESNWNFVPLVMKKSVPDYWIYEMDSFSIGTKRWTDPARKQPVIVDTGSSWVSAPAEVVVMIVRRLNAEYDFENDLYFAACNVTGLPDWVFRIGARDYHVPSSAYLVPMGSGRCALTIYPKPIVDGWVIGDTLIRRYCHAFDIGQQRIGLATAKHR